jgi:hypothetical protein
MDSFAVVEEQLIDVLDFGTHLLASLCIGLILEVRFATSYILKM